MNEQPNFYAILPATVRYAKDLSEFQKLLYAEITALADKHGYCWANNRYFANLYEKDSTRVSKSLKDLWEKWYLNIEQIKEEWNTRKIYIWELKKLKKIVNVPIKEKCKTSCRKVQDPSCSKLQDPLAEKCKHNNTSLILQEWIEEKAPTPPHKNIDFINWMRDVEIRGSFRLKIWNEKTWREDIMNDEIKKSMYSIMKNVTGETFEQRISKYVEVIGVIQEKSLRNYIFFQIREYDFLQFLSKINQFYWEVPTILSKIAKNEYKTKIVWMAKRPENNATPQQEVVKKTVVDEATRLQNNNKFREQLNWLKSKLKN